MQSRRAVLAGDVANEEEAETGSLDAQHCASGNTIEATEDALVLVGGKADTGIGNSQRSPGVVGNGERTANVHAFRGILDRIVEQVEDRGAKIFRNTRDAEMDSSGDWLKDYRICRKMVALKCDRDAVADERLEIDESSILLALLLAELARFENLLDGGKEAIRIGKHDGVELLALGLVDGPRWSVSR